jgi:hypothetical protein
MKAVIIDINNHRHNGEIVPVGTSITINDQTADRLIAAGKAHIDAQPVATPKIIDKG